MRTRRLTELAARPLVVLAACGSDGKASGGALDKLGKAEGQVNVVAWPGYVEKGGTDPKVDWISAWEKSSGCTVNVKLGATSDEMVQLMKTGEYDVVSASGDATLRLIAGGDVVLPVWLAQRLTDSE
jgi:putative spermidine/putrescine transport system substrate-binding protein